KNFAARILEIHVDAVGAFALQGGGDVFLFVVDAGVEPEILHDVSAFLIRTRDAHHAAAFQLGDLADDGADRACRRRDHHGFTGFRFADIEQSEIGREPGHAEHAHRGGRRHARRQLHAAIGEREFLPACDAGKEIALLEIGIVRLLDDADGAAAHDLADLHRRHVLLHVAHPDPVGGIEREIERAHQYLTRSRHGDGRFHQFEVARLDVADGPFPEHPLPIAVAHCCSPCCHLSNLNITNLRVARAARKGYMPSMRFFLAMALFLLGSLPAAAQVEPGPKVAPRLVAERSIVAPGERVPVALELKMKPGWQAGEIEWPYPKRLPVGPLMDYGYEGTVWLLTAVQAPAAAKPGDTVTLNATGSWLVCREVCIPEDANLTLPITVAEQGVVSPVTAAQFASARAKLPQASPWRATYRAADDKTLDIFLESPTLAAARPTVAN